LTEREGLRDKVQVSPQTTGRAADEPPCATLRTR
jgi:hypothetical protein